jgi:antitoxin component YwqK of YwqJK toxin-antitoxin module
MVNLPKIQVGSMGRKWTFAMAALALLTGAVAALFFLRPSTPTPHEESASSEPMAVARTNLILVAGRLNLPDQGPFSGLMLEHSADGVLRSRSSVSNGLLHGISEGWHTNGQLQVTEHFKDGVSHGLRTKWYSSGARLSEGEIVEGRFHGTFRRWSESGALLEQVEFVAGQPHGVAMAYYESGFVKKWARIKEGKVIEQQSWNDLEHRETPSTEFSEKL